MTDDEDEPFDGKIDIGGGHKLRMTTIEWDEEHLELNPWYRPLAERFGSGPHPYGLIDFHDVKDRPGERHGGGITFNTEITRAYHEVVDARARELGHAVLPHVTWELHSLDPLHVEPSLLCGCGSHGFIRAGAWVEC